MHSKTVQFVRHGESASNAGEFHADRLAIPLTDLGRQQAEAFHARHGDRLGYVMASEMKRAKDTARCAVKTLALFNELNTVPLEVALRGKEAAYKAHHEFLDSSDPTFYFEGAESFAGMVGRVRAALRTLELIHQPLITVFCHSHFMSLTKFVIEGRADKTNSKQQFRRMTKENHIQNCEMMTTTFNGRHWDVVGHTTL